jgi:hypothetical protein
MKNCYVLEEKQYEVFRDGQFSEGQKKCKIDYHNTDMSRLLITTYTSKLERH